MELWTAAVLHAQTMFPWYMIHHTICTASQLLAEQNILTVHLRLLRTSQLYVHVCTTYCLWDDVTPIQTQRHREHCELWPATNNHRHTSYTNIDRESFLNVDTDKTFHSGHFTVSQTRLLVGLGFISPKPRHRRRFTDGGPLFLMHFMKYMCEHIREKFKIIQITCVYILWTNISIHSSLQITIQVKVSGLILIIRCVHHELVLPTSVYPLSQPAISTNKTVQAESIPFTRSYGVPPPLKTLNSATYLSQYTRANLHLSATRHARIWQKLDNS